MASSPENHMHPRPGDEIQFRFLDRQDIINQLELIAQGIILLNSQDITINCTHSPSLIKPNLSADQNLTNMQPVRIAKTPQLGPLPTLTVEIKVNQFDLTSEQVGNKLNEVRKRIEQVCHDSPFVTGPAYPRQTGEENAVNQTKILIRLPTNRHRTVS